MDRRTKLLSMFDASGYGLEIGPSYNPLLPKAEGFRVETLDHADQQSLRTKYGREPTVDIKRIEVVDHVSDGRSMCEVIGRTQAYDFIVASHVIEHTPDMIGFLQDCEALLKPDGVLVLAVPDMRFCFDCYKSLTSLGEIYEAHVERRTRHTRASLFDHSAYFAEVDGASGWPRAARGTPALKHPLSTAVKMAARYDDGGYIDNHAWQFVPSSFRLIIQDLKEIGEIGFRELAFQETDVFEVLVTMSASGRGSGLSRVELLRKAADEMAEVSDLVRGASPAPNPTLERDLDHARRELAEASAREARLRSDIEEAQARISALEGSTSWRVTRPLRMLRGG